MSSSISGGAGWAAGGRSHLVEGSGNRKWPPGRAELAVVKQTLSVAQCGGQANSRLRENVTRASHPLYVRLEKMELKEMGVLFPILLHPIREIRKD